MKLALAAVLLVLGMSVAREDSSSGRDGDIRRAPGHPVRGSQGVGAVGDGSLDASRPDSPSSGRADGNERGAGGRHGSAGRSHTTWTTAGGPLSPCPGRAQFDNSYRWSNGTVRRGCATGYSAEREGITDGTACGPRLRDDVATTAVSINVPVLNNGLRPKCGAWVLVCGRGCVAVRITDRGPYVIGTGGDYGRDFDLSVEARRRIGVNVSLSSWGDPVIVWWRLCSATCVRRNA